MIFRALTSQGDWLFGKGINDYLLNQAAIEANIKTRLLSWVNDCFFALQDGIDWRNRLDAGQKQNLIEEVKGNLLQAVGVVGINSVDAVFDGRTRHIRITYDIQTIFSVSFQSSINQTVGGV